MLANDIPSTFVTCNMQRKQDRQQTTPQYHSSFHGERLQNLYSSICTYLICASISAVGLFLGRKSKIFIEENPKEFQFYIPTHAKFQASRCNN